MPPSGSPTSAARNVALRLTPSDNPMMSRRSSLKKAAHKSNRCHPQNSITSVSRKRRGKKYGSIGDSEYLRSRPSKTFDPSRAEVRYGSRGGLGDRDRT